MEKHSSNYLAAISSRALQDGMLSEEDVKQIQYRLWLLLGQRTERYTMGDSTSVPVETAEELFKSICFSIGLYLKSNGNPELLKVENMQVLLSAAWHTIEQYIKKGKLLLQQAENSTPQIKNISLQDTLAEIRTFFKRYDYRFFAHDVPCSIDYQLCHTVTENLLGIEYVCEYLRRLVIENTFCSRFDAQTVIMLLQSYCQDYRGLLINIYEAVAVNAIGCALLQGDIKALDITSVDQEVLLDKFKRWPTEEARGKLRTGVVQVCRELGIEDANEQNYLMNIVNGLMPRIKVAVANGSLSNVFLPLCSGKKSSQSTVQYIDGELMDDEGLRNLIDEISSCRFVSDKVAMVKQYIHSLQDLVEVLSICFWNEDLDILLGELDDSVIALLQAFVRSKGPDWHTDTGWEYRLP